MKINWIDKFAETDLTDVFTELEALGVVFDDTADIVVCGSINKQDKAWKELYARKKVINYCWDFYKWAREGKSPYYDWKKYEELLKNSIEIWVPSTAQQLRLSEWGIKSEVIHTYIKCWDFKTRNKGFALDHVRYYPEENKHWAELAGRNVALEVIHSEHKFSKDEFYEKVADCSFLVCALREASTGGLPLVQALWNGKPSLISDSPYQGATDYLGKFATTFKYNDFKDLEHKMSDLYLKPKYINKRKAREFINANFTAKVMADKIYTRLCELSNK